MIVGGGSYLYVSYISTEIEAINEPMPLSEKSKTPTSTPKKIQQNQMVTNKQPHMAERILTSEDQLHLNAYEQNLVHRGENASSVMKYAPLGDKLRLKYYDEQTVVFELLSQKIGMVMSVYDIDTLTHISSHLYLDAIEGREYSVFVGDGDATLMYYKKGEREVKIVPNSTLPGTETYGKAIAGMGLYDYEFSVDEPTKTVTASIFKPVDDPDGKENPKTRTATFMLP